VPDFIFEQIQVRHNPILSTCRAFLGPHTPILEYPDGQSRKNQAARVATPRPDGFPISNQKSTAPPTGRKRLCGPPGHRTYTRGTPFAFATNGKLRCIVRATAAIPDRVPEDDAAVFGLPQIVEALCRPSHTAAFFFRSARNHSRAASWS